MLVSRRSPKLNTVPSAPLPRSMAVMRSVPAAGVSGAAVQPLLAVFAIYPSRARYVILDFIGEKCTAAVTSDRYAGYAFIDVERRQVCWVRICCATSIASASATGWPGRSGAGCWGWAW